MRRFLLWGVLALALVPLAGLLGCSTATPVLIESGKSTALKGRVNTTAGYTGEITTDKAECRGSFTGAIGMSAAPLELSCIDGRRGVGTAILVDGRFVSGEVRMSDGTRVTVKPSGSGFP